jgi:hypothetical protein
MKLKRIICEILREHNSVTGIGDITKISVLK